MSPELQQVMLLVVLAVVALTATAAVLTRVPQRQAIVLSAYGLVMGLLMVVFHAPDVAMSQLAIGSAAVPLLIVLAITACDRESRARGDTRKRQQREDR
ncbi:MAG TPA: DUF4040 domain-containing protein [Nocardioidaceae bacterium]|jgi:uncharacterized MnhB-related membrane protein